MTIDRTHLGWAAFTLSATALAGTCYLIVFHPDTLAIKANGMVMPGGHYSNDPFCRTMAFLQGGFTTPMTDRAGGTPLGLIYGGLSLLIFFFAALIGMRRKLPAWPLGSMQTWLKGHIWLTLLTIPLVIFHSGVNLGGTMTQVLMLLYAVVMVSGLLGLGLQHLLPRLMRQVLPNEVVFDQIPYLCETLVADATKARRDLEAGLAVRADESHGKVGVVTAAHLKANKTLNMIDEEVIPYLQVKSPRHSRLERSSSAERLFKFMAHEIPSAHREPVDRLRGLCDEKRKMNVQARLQYWLHGWILFHAPLSLLLIVLTIWHAVVACYVY